MPQDQGHGTAPVSREGVQLEALAADINAEHQKAEAAAKCAALHVYRTGKLLIHAKKQVGHGGWLPWLGANCEVSERQAQTYMRVARELPESEATADLTLAGALRKIEAASRVSVTESRRPPTPGRVVALAAVRARKAQSGEPRRVEVDWGELKRHRTTVQHQIEARTGTPPTRADMAERELRRWADLYPAEAHAALHTVFPEFFAAPSGG